MRVAISTDGGSVSMHFGRCPEFTIVDLDESGNVTNKFTLANPGHFPGAIPKFLKENDVECIVAGGMGQRAIGFFNEEGIKTILGISGSINDIVDKLSKGELSGGESLCKPGAGKGYGIDKETCDHPEDKKEKC